MTLRIPIRMFFKALEIDLELALTVFLQDVFEVLIGHLGLDSNPKASGHPDAVPAALLRYSKENTTLTSFPWITTIYAGYGETDNKMAWRRP